MVTTTTKTSALLKEIIFQYHPDVKDNQEVQNFLSEHQDWVNVERMVEETMAAVGGYNFVDGDGYDFDDGDALGCANSECKTASVWPNPVKGSCVSHVLEISNVCKAGPQGGTKFGTLRVVLYNPISETVRYYFIPKHYWEEMVTIHPTTKIGKIKANWNSKSDTCNKLDKFQVKNFKALAQIAPNALDDITF